MARIHDGLARHGMAWFAHDQFMGKGQREKSWNSAVGENIVLTIVIQPVPEIGRKPFLISAALALLVVDFLQTVSSHNFHIKWPNDIYHNDRKAGGILIENVWSGSEWKWCIAGIGININQVRFPAHLPNPTSLHLITGQHFDVVALSRQLHSKIVSDIGDLVQQPDLLKRYNEHLFARNQQVLFSTPSESFVAEVSGVNEEGKLLLKDYPERAYAHGELVWEITAKSR